MHSGPKRPLCVATTALQCGESWFRGVDVCRDVGIDRRERVVEREQNVAEESDLASLFRTHATPLRRMLSGMRSGAASRNLGIGAIDVDDLVQETFLRAIRRRWALPPSNARAAYLFAIARNLYIDGLRRCRGVSTELDEQSEEQVSFAPQEDSDFEQRMERLARYIETLQPSLLVVYQTRFVRGLSQRDTALELAMSRRQVRTLEGRLLAGAERALGAIYTREGGAAAAPPSRCATRAG